jgi:hypothetical protein
MDQFSESGLQILRAGLSDCDVDIIVDKIIVKCDKKCITLSVDFDKLFKMVDDDLILRQRDSRDFYWGSLISVIRRELDAVVGP